MQDSADANQSTDNQPTSRDRNTRNDTSGGGSNKRGGNKNKKNQSSFKGSTPGLSACVFFVKGERNDAPSFAQCTEALQHYCGTHYDSAKQLKSIFAVTPSMPVPKAKEYETEPFKDESGETTEERAERKRRYDQFCEKISEQFAKRFADEIFLIAKDVHALFAVIMGQCSDAMKERVKELKDFDDNEARDNCVWLLQNIRNLMTGLGGRTDPFVTVVKALFYLTNITQSHHQDTHTPARYIDKIRALDRDLTELGGIDIVFKGALVDDSWGSTDAERQQEAKRRFLGRLAVWNADPVRYSNMIDKMADDYATGRKDVYPNSLEDARQLLSHFGTKKRSRHQKHDTNRASPGGSSPASGPNQQGASFSQTAQPVPGTDGQLHETIKCFSCNRYGHYAPQCPNGNTGVQLSQLRIPIPVGAILMDSDSSHSIFCNSEYLSDIRREIIALQLGVNGGGGISANYTGAFHMIPPTMRVWYNPESIANILSLGQVTQTHRVTFDSSADKAFYVHIGPIAIRFGLYQLIPL